MHFQWFFNGPYEMQNGGAIAYTFEEADQSGPEELSSRLSVLISLLQASRHAIRTWRDLGCDMAFGIFYRLPLFPREYWA